MEDVIKSLKKLGDPNGDFTMYTIGVNFESGKSGIAFAKSFPPPYEAGMLVLVEEKGQTAKGTQKFGIKKINQQGGSTYQPQATNAVQGNSGASGASSSGRNGQRDGMLFKLAGDLIIAGVDPSTIEGKLFTMVKAVESAMGQFESGDNGLAESVASFSDSSEDLPF